MTDLTPAERRRFAIDGVLPYRAMGEIIVAGVVARILHYPPPTKARPHPDDDAKLRAAYKVMVEAELKP